MRLQAVLLWLALATALALPGNALSAPTPVYPAPGATIRNQLVIPDDHTIPGDPDHTSYDVHFRWSLPQNEKAESLCVWNKPAPCRYGDFAPGLYAVAFDDNLNAGHQTTEAYEHAAVTSPRYAGTYYWTVITNAYSSYDPIDGWLCPCTEYVSTFPFAIAREFRINPHYTYDHQRSIFDPPVMNMDVSWIGTVPTAVLHFRLTYRGHLLRQRAVSTPSRYGDGAVERFWWNNWRPAGAYPRGMRIVPRGRRLKATWWARAGGSTTRSASATFRAP